MRTLLVDHIQRTGSPLMQTIDVEAIRSLEYTYALLLDGGDFEGVASLLQHAQLSLHGVGLSGEPVSGRDRIRDFYATQVITFDGDPRTRHVITNLLIEEASRPGTARARSYFTVQQKAPGMH